MHRIQTVSKGMVFALALALLALVLLAAVYVAYPRLFLQGLYSAYNLSPNIPPLSAWQDVAMVGIVLLNLLPPLFVIWQLRKMFQRFAKGEVFSAAATRHLFRAAIGMVAMGIINILSTTVSVLVLTANAPAGGHVLAINISSSEVSSIFTGAVFAVMSWVMQEAARLSEENAGFV